ncbi:MAG: HAD-IC family P-type ATPase, partial [Thermodesulfobacteriota bacterium]
MSTAAEASRERSRGEVRAPERPWSRAAGETAQGLGVDPAQGLAQSEARERLRRFGPNRLEEAPRRSLWAILFDQFRSLMVLLLAAASLVSVLFGNWLEGLAIGVALLINAAIGFGTELKATRSMEALRELGKTRARVRRGGSIHEVDDEEVVPGDLVLLEAGDLVPADLRLVEANNLQVDEASLTGESVPRQKQVEPVAPDAPLAERDCLCHKGTALTAGSGAGIAFATGMETQLGRVASLATAEAEQVTPLERRLEQLSRRLIGGTAGVAVVVTAAGLVGGKDWLLMLKTAIAMAVAAVPEGLPIVATIALARGVRRMAARNALINRLSAVETLGATDVICTDKTGTLTENRMRVRRVDLPGREVPF